MKENLFCGCFVLSVEIKSGNLRSLSPQRYSSNTNIFCIIYQALRTPKYRHGYIPKGNAQYVKISKKKMPALQSDILKGLCSTLRRHIQRTENLFLIRLVFRLKSQGHIGYNNTHRI